MRNSLSCQEPAECARALGLRAIVVEDYQQPDVRLEYFFDSSYAGFDRFGRVVDQRWYDYGASADRDRYTYGYDRASNRLYRENITASGKDEFYSYLCLSQLSPACFFMVVRSGVRANIPRASLQLARIWREVRSVRLRCDQRGRVVRGLEAVSRHATSFALVG